MIINNALMDNDNNESVITMNDISTVLSSEKQNIYSQGSYDSQTQTQTQTQKVVQAPIKFSENQWALLRNFKSFQSSDFYCSLPKKNICVGRHSNCDYILKGSYVSSIHFKLHLRRNEITKEFYVEIENVGKNGTLVNSVSVNGPLTLSNNDIITISKENNQYYEFIFILNTSFNLNINSVFKKYEMKKFLGSGSFSTVKEAVRKSDGSQFAIKIIDANKFYFDEKAKIGFKREISILKRLNHNNIIKFYECIEEEGKIYIVTELMKGGNLLKLIEQKKGIPEIETRILFKQILDGIKYLHDRNITHRDIKPDNILLKIDKCNTIINDSYSQSIENVDDFKVTAKISDFGLAKNDNFGLQTVCGTPQYLAPEIMNETNSINYYDSKVDCWSLGVVLFQMISNLLPHKNGNKSIIDFSNNIWTEVSFNVIQLIENLLIVDKDKRYSVDQSLNHEWFSMEPESMINDPILSFNITKNWGIVTLINDKETLTINMNTSKFTIGSNRRCQTMISDNAISQLHIVFSFNGYAAYIIDKSKNSNDVFLNGYIIEKNKPIILNKDSIIKIIDSDDKKYHIIFDTFSDKPTQDDHSISQQSNSRKRKYSDNNQYSEGSKRSSTIDDHSLSQQSDSSKRKHSDSERSKRSSTIGIQSQVRNVLTSSKKKVMVIYNENNKKLEPSFANLSLSNEEVWMELIPINNNYSKLLIKKDSFTIGRNSSCLISINDLVISNYHADIKRDTNGIIYLIDKSSNGTYINHKKIKKQKVIINNNDKIIFTYKDYKKVKDDNNVEIGYIVSLK